VIAPKILKTNLFSLPGGGKDSTCLLFEGVYHNVARPLQRGVYIFDKHNGNMLSVRRKPGNKKGGYMWTP
jgi:hypothetical protein